MAKRAAPRHAAKGKRATTKPARAAKPAGRTRPAAKAPAPARRAARAAARPAPGRIRIAVDIGGTFTDGVAEITPGGRIWVAKTLTTPDDPGEAVSTVVRDLLRQLDAGQPAAAATAGTSPSAGRVAEVVHGTTLVTNTLIERKGARTGLVCTRGTGDALDIGREVRYDLYDLELKLPEPLVPPERRAEADERLGADGEVVTALSAGAIEDVLGQVADMQVDSVAVCFLHSYVNDAHERAMREALKARLPGLAVSISSQVAREIREYERMSTVAASAYVQPLVDRYMTALDRRMQEIGVPGPLRIMVSSGGFTSAKAAAEVPILLLESGPAGGVLSAVNTALEAGIKDVLAFDMGGTTAKACVTVGGEPSLAHSFEAARVHRFKKGSGLPVMIPSIDLIEIGAGGGSIARINNLGLLNVGPESSGAQPGPACYGQGGEEATVTDADLVLGYLNPDNFLGGEMKLRKDLAEQALGRLAAKLRMSLTDVAYGIHNIVNENMAAAARVHVAEKGYDPRRFTLVGTGGAGPVHVVEVARKLGLKRVLCTIAAGAGSCLGLLAAPARVDRSFSHPQLVTDIDWAEVGSTLAALRSDAEAELAGAGAGNGKSAGGARIGWYLSCEMRYAGQGHNVTATIPWPKRFDAKLAPAFVKAFEAEYGRLYGQLVPGGQPQAITWRITGRSDVKSRGFAWGDDRAAHQQRGTPKPTHKRAIWQPLKKGYGTVPVYDRYSLAPGTRLAGPVVLEERESTIVVPVPAAVTILKDLTVSVELKHRT